MSQENKTKTGPRATLIAAHTESGWNGMDLITLVRRTDKWGWIAVNRKGSLYGFSSDGKRSIAFAVSSITEGPMNGTSLKLKGMISSFLPPAKNFGQRYSRGRIAINV